MDMENRKKRWGKDVPEVFGPINFMDGIVIN